MVSIAKTRTKLIIPAAGYGRRVGSPEAKELLPSIVDGVPLIDFSLTLAKEFNFHAHVITRTEKKSLIEFLEEKNIESQIVSPTAEWPATILASQSYWHEKNIVVLPDTRFNPKKILEVIDLELETNDVVFACFKAEDYSTWGTIRSISVGSFEVWEKPSENNRRQAWGIFGFRKTVGERLLNVFLKSTLEKKPIQLDLKYKVLDLETFVDLTR